MLLVLLRFRLRRDQLRRVVWAVALAVLLLIAASAMTSTYPTVADRIGVLPVALVTPALLVLRGTPQGTSLGDITVFEIATFQALLVGLMSTFLVVRNTQAEEDRGTAEALAATAAGQALLPAVATLLEGVVANVLATAVSAVALIAGGLPVAGSVVFGVALDARRLLGLHGARAADRPGRADGTVGERLVHRPGARGVCPARHRRCDGHAASAGRHADAGLGERRRARSAGCSRCGRTPPTTCAPPWSRSWSARSQQPPRSPCSGRGPRRGPRPRAQRPGGCVPRARRAGRPRGPAAARQRDRVGIGAVLMGVLGGDLATVVLGQLGSAPGVTEAMGLAGRTRQRPAGQAASS